MDSALPGTNSQKLLYEARRHQLRGMRGTRSLNTSHFKKQRDAPATTADMTKILTSNCMEMARAISCKSGQALRSKIRPAVQKELHVGKWVD